MISQRPLTNDLLRVKRLAAGLTERQLAEAVAKVVSAQTGHRAALDGNYISKLERGRITWPNSAYRSALREFFDAATDAELGFYAARTRRDAERSVPGRAEKPPGSAHRAPPVHGETAEWPLVRVISFPALTRSEPGPTAAGALAVSDGK